MVIQVACLRSILFNTARVLATFGLVVTMVSNRATRCSKSSLFQPSMKVGAVMGPQG